MLDIDKLNKVFNKGEILTAKELTDISSKVDEIIDKAEKLPESTSNYPYIWLDPKEPIGVQTIKDPNAIYVLDSKGQGDYYIKEGSSDIIFICKNIISKNGEKIKIREDHLDTLTLSTGSWDSTFNLSCLDCTNIKEIKILSRFFSGNTYTITGEIPNESKTQLKIELIAQENSDLPSINFINFKSQNNVIIKLVNFGVLSFISPVLINIINSNIGDNTTSGLFFLQNGSSFVNSRLTIGVDLYIFHSKCIILDSYPSIHAVDSKIYFKDDRSKDYTTRSKKLNSTYNFYKCSITISVVLDYECQMGIYSCDEVDLKINYLYSLTLKNVREGFISLDKIHYVDISDSGYLDRTKSSLRIYMINTGSSGGIICGKLFKVNNSYIHFESSLNKKESYYMYYDIGNTYISSPLYILGPFKKIKLHNSIFSSLYSISIAYLSDYDTRYTEGTIEIEELPYQELKIFTHEISLSTQDISIKWKKSKDTFRSSKLHIENPKSNYTIHTYNDSIDEFYVKNKDPKNTITYVLDNYSSLPKLVNPSTIDDIDFIKRESRVEEITSLKNFSRWDNPSDSIYDKSTGKMYYCSIPENPKTVLTSKDWRDFNGNSAGLPTIGTLLERPTKGMATGFIYVVTDEDNTPYMYIKELDKWISLSTTNSSPALDIPEGYSPILIKDTEVVEKRGD